MTAERSVAILLYDDVEVLDFAAPFEVFSVAGRRHDRNLFDVFTVAQHARPINARNGLRVVPKYSMHDCPPADVLVIPGGYGSRREICNPVMLDWVGRMAESAEVILSVCTGALILAAVGLLGGLEATTHRGALELLAATDPTCKVVTRRVVDTGAIVSTAGVSAGIDGALQIVARLTSVPIAAECAAYIEYDWVVPIDA